MHLGKIPKKTFIRKLEDVGLVVCGKIPCLYGITTVSGGGLGGSGQSCPQVEDPKFVAFPCRFATWVQVQIQLAGATSTPWCFPVAQTKWWAGHV